MTSTDASAQPGVDSFLIHKVTDVAAPLEITFEALLAQLGPECEMPDGKPFPMKLEAWPGGRWYRDLGDNSGHLWGHVQVIKPPTIVEIYGPLMMSYAAVNHLQFRLAADGEGTRMEFYHRTMGVIQDDHREGLSNGWQYWIERIVDLSRTRVQRGS